MVRGSKHDALNAVTTGGLEQVMATDDICPQDGVPGPFHRKAAEMDDPVDPGDRLLDGWQLGQVGLHELLMGCEIGRRRKIAHTEFGIAAMEQSAQPRADSPGCARNQHRLHEITAAPS